jgi:hypothetical protein
MKVTGPSQVKDSDFKQSDSQDPIYPSQTQASLNPLPVPLLGRTTALTSSEQKYLEVGPLGTGGNDATGYLEKQVNFKLSSLRKTLAARQELLLPGEHGA